MNPRAPAAAPKDVEARKPAVEPAPFPPEELKKECEETLTRYPTKMAALLPVLHLAQAHYDNWISPEVAAGIAQYLGISDAHVSGVLSFYAMYNTEAPSKHEVWVCRTLTCWLRGAPKLRELALQKAGAERTGKVTEDGTWLVKDMECLGLCEVAPAVFVDGTPHTEVTPERFEELLDACE